MRIIHRSFVDAMWATEVVADDAPAAAVNADATNNNPEMRTPLTTSAAQTTMLFMAMKLSKSNWKLAMFGNGQGHGAPP
jgi:hypothetical protein